MRPADLASLLNLPARFDQKVRNSQIETDWKFDGQMLDSQHQLNFEGVVNLTESDATPQCTVQIEADGSLGFRADIVSQQAWLDLSALPVKLSADNCPSFYLNHWHNGNRRH